MVVLVVLFVDIKDEGVIICSGGVGGGVSSWNNVITGFIAF